jgi:hypothetical protein
MRLLKIFVFASALAAGGAFAGEESAELLNEEAMAEEELAMDEHEVVYIYPMEVTEYYILVPSPGSEMPG